MCSYPSCAAKAILEDIFDNKISDMMAPWIDYVSYFLYRNRSHSLKTVIFIPLLIRNALKV